MSELPDTVGRYLELASAARADDAKAIAACFAEGAEVTDEGEPRRGRAAIRQWWEGPATAYRYTVEVRGSRRLDDDHYIVFTRLTGNFPGGTADLANRFTLRYGLIASLEISPPRDGEHADASSSG